MLDIAFVIIPTQMPDTAPRGSGNTGGQFGRFNSPLYPGIADNIDTENNRNIDLETNTGT